MEDEAVTFDWGGTFLCHLFLAATDNLVFKAVQQTGNYSFDLKSPKTSVVDQISRVHRSSSSSEHQHVSIGGLSIQFPSTLLGHKTFYTDTIHRFPI